MAIELHPDPLIDKVQNLKRGINRESSVYTMQFCKIETNSKFVSNCYSYWNHCEATRIGKWCYIYLYMCISILYLRFHKQPSIKTINVCYWICLIDGSFSAKIRKRKFPVSSGSKVVGIITYVPGINLNLSLISLELM